MCFEILEVKLHTTGIYVLNAFLPIPRIFQLIVMIWFLFITFQGNFDPISGLNVKFSCYFDQEPIIVDEPYQQGGYYPLLGRGEFMLPKVNCRNIRVSKLLNYVLWVANNLKLRTNEPDDPLPAKLDYVPRGVFERINF